MINYIIPLLSSFLPIWTNYLVILFALAFVCTVPKLIREIVRFR